MNQMNTQTTVGDMVRQKPSRSRVFEKLGIDYCCGGKLSLEVACTKNGLKSQEVLEELQALDAAGDGQTAGDVDADSMTLSALADHIEQTHHMYLKRELPRLGALVRKVVSAHGQNHPWTRDVDALYAPLASELLTHLMKEEQILFPLIRALETGQGGPASASQMSVAAPIGVMEHEHDAAGDALAKIRQLSTDFTAPSDACNTFRAMLDGLLVLEKDLHQHVHKENNVLFPKAIALELNAKRK